MKLASLLVLPTLLLLPACVEHRATLRPAAGDAAPQIVMPGHGPTILEDPLHARGSLPQALHGSAWYRRPDGSLERAELHVLSPRPWWQRFPADLFTDLLIPKRFTAVNERAVVTTPVTAMSMQELDERARQRGYLGGLDNDERERE